MVETYSGYFKRTLNVERAMQFKTVQLSTKKRTNFTGKFAEITTELSSDVLLVQRVYPNIIDLFSEVGGLAKVIIVVCLIFGHFHNDILMEMSVINQAIIEIEDNDDSKQANKFFGYFEIAKFKYLCKGKSVSARRKQYDEFNRIFSQRLDIATVFRNLETTDCVSKLMLDPYQVKVSSRFR